MEFWNSLLTEKSWKIMQDLKKEKFRFIVIGGWAAFLWTKQHKSKDIDVIIPKFNDLEILKQKYTLNKNDDLKKYEIKIGDIDVDIYLPYYSKLSLPVDVLCKYVTKVEGFEVVIPEVLLILKQGAEFDRGESIKGVKDRIDIMTLLIYSNIDFEKYLKILNENKLEHYNVRLKTIIKNFKDLKYIGLNENEFSKIKKKLLEKV